MSPVPDFKTADDVIEQFGGIRPLANKLGVPFTTVQGWKKRNAIPKNRWAEIQKLAKDMNLSLTDDNDAVPVSNVEPLIATTRIASSPAKEKNNTKRGYSMAQGVLVTGLSVALSVGILAILFGPDFIVSNPNQRLAALEKKINDTAPQGTSTVGIEGLQGLQATIDNTIMPKLNELQAQVGALGDPAALADLSKKLETLQSSPEGQATLSAAVTELQTIVKGLQGNVENLDVALVAAQKDNGALAETIGKVSTTDLTAAAMLLALNQFRSSIDRQEPLADDLALLKSVINPDENPDLANSIDRLTPFASSGVMSASGLQTELTATAGAIVEARLKGNKAPWQDIAAARFQQIFDIRRNGQPVMGTQEQKIIAKAQQELASGNVAAAKSTLETLPAPSRAVAQPIIDKANQNIVAKQVESDVTRHFAQSMQSLKAGVTPPPAAPTEPAALPEPPPTTGIAPVTPPVETPPDVLSTQPAPLPTGTTPPTASPIPEITTPQQ